MSALVLVGLLLLSADQRHHRSAQHRQPGPHPPPSLAAQRQGECRIPRDEPMPPSHNSHPQPVPPAPAAGLYVPYTDQTNGKGALALRLRRGAVLAPPRSSRAPANGTSYLPIWYALPSLAPFRKVRAETAGCESKPRDWAPALPSRPETQRFETERAYYAQYASSLFGVTTPKAGLDCLRHYQILASGAVPFFVGSRNLTAALARPPGPCHTTFADELEWVDAHFVREVDPALGGPAAARVRAPARSHVLAAPTVTTERRSWWHDVDMARRR